MNVFYVGDPRAQQLGWLVAAGASVIQSERGEEAATMSAEDAAAMDVAVLDADWPGLGCFTAS